MTELAAEVCFSKNYTCANYELPAGHDSIALTRAGRGSQAETKKHTCYRRCPAVASPGQRAKLRQLTNSGSA